MSKKVLFISEKQIKEQSSVELNADPKALSKVILEVQETTLKQVIGTVLYSQLTEEISTAYTEQTDLSPAPKTLLNDYVIPYMIYAVLVDFIVVNNYKITNKGVMKMNDTNAGNLSASELETAKNYYMGRASSRKKALVDYLYENKILAKDADTNVTSSGIGWNIHKYR